MAGRVRFEIVEQDPAVGTIRVGAVIEDGGLRRILEALLPVYAPYEDEDGNPIENPSYEDVAMKWFAGMLVGGRDQTTMSDAGVVRDEFEENYEPISGEGEQQGKITVREL